MAILAKKGAHILCVNRNVDKSKLVVDEVIRSTGNSKIEIIQADLADLASVERAAGEILAKDVPVHMLILNAGTVSGFKMTLTKDGIETQFATNHVAHFLLLQRLLHVLEKTALSGQPVRVVAVSSAVNTGAPPEGIAFDKINDERSYSMMRRYGECIGQDQFAVSSFLAVFKDRFDNWVRHGTGESKLANILTMKELQRQMDQKHGKNIQMYC
ncbi:hypothetical protein HDU93_005938, partial [Gonapodya sp. JEL0774]